jgi:hypothetical protein
MPPRAQSADVAESSPLIVRLLIFCAARRADSLRLPFNREVQRMLACLFRRKVSGAFPSASLRTRCGFAAATLACAVALSASAAATEITDAAGDFLATFGGTHSADLDVTAASVTFSNNTFHLSATLAGNVGSSTPNAAYIWGIDRGAGTAILNQGSTPVGAGVTFDMVAVLFPNGTAILSNIDQNGPFGTPTPLSLTIAGDTMTVDIPLSLLPATEPGTDVEEYRFNFWPRVGLDVGHGEQVSDFAPGGTDGVGTTFTVPEPGALALMVAGVVGAGVMRRRRSATTAL